jgi:hypothetical protein
MRDADFSAVLYRHVQFLDRRAPAIGLNEIEARATTMLDEPAPRASRRRRLGLVAVAAAVVLALVVAVAVVSGARDDTSPTGRPAGPDARQLSHYRWSELPPSPYPGRMDAATVWTGHEMIVWGGVTSGPGSALSNAGTAYDPRANTWRVLPSSPLLPRQDAAAVWTGKTMFVWGGASSVQGQAAGDGALYDPRSDVWRALPNSPLSPRGSAQAVWTGKEVVVIGGFARDANGSPVAATDAAAYDPVRSAWHRLRPMPLRRDHPVAFVVPLWIGNRLLVWQYWAVYGPDRNAFGAVAAGIDLVSYSPSTNRWRRVPSSKRAPVTLYQGVWTGREVLVPSSSQWDPNPGYHGSEPAYRYDPRTNRWHPLASGPLDNGPGIGAWTGRALVAINTSTTYVGAGGHADLAEGDGAVYDPGTDRWRSLERPPAAPVAAQTIIWTGREILVPTDLGPFNDPASAIRSSGGLRLGP